MAGITQTGRIVHCRHSIPCGYLNDSLLLTANLASPPSYCLFSPAVAVTQNRQKLPIKGEVDKTGRGD